jgi:hypothetical protein
MKFQRAKYKKRSTQFLSSMSFSLSSVLLAALQELDSEEDGRSKDGCVNLVSCPIYQAKYATPGVHVESKESRTVLEAVAGKAGTVNSIGDVAARRR